jgi:hypothetical protein
MKKARRQESKEPSVSTGQFSAKLGMLIDMTVPLAVMYRDCLDEAYGQTSGAEVHVKTGSSDNVLNAAAFPTKFQRQRRADANTAVAYVKQAASALHYAERVLRGEPVEQPEMIDARATQTQEDFDRRRQRMRVSAEHIRREEELRR